MSADQEKIENVDARTNAVVPEDYLELSQMAAQVEIASARQTHSRQAGGRARSTRTSPDPPPPPYTTLENGPGCDVVVDITTSEECSTAAVALGFSRDVLAGRWGHAPLRCFVGQPSYGWTKTYFNTRRGQTRRDGYKSICNQDAVYEARRTRYLGKPRTRLDQNERTRQPCNQGGRARHAPNNSRRRGLSSRKWLRGLEPSHVPCVHHVT